MTETYPRVAFELPGDTTPLRLPDPAGVGWRAPVDEAELVAVFAAALKASVDPRDGDMVRRYGAHAVVASMLRHARAADRYWSKPGWWSVVTLDGVAAGFVLPVVFTGCSRDGLDEGTIFHIGVDPRYRGQGLGRVLLGQATDTLLQHGVWQITTDTAVENEPMIRTFTGLGYLRR